MRAIIGIISALGVIYWGAPKLANKVYYEIKVISLKQISKPMTPLSTISKGLTKQNHSFQKDK